MPRFSRQILFQALALLTLAAAPLALRAKVTSLGHEPEIHGDRLTFRLKAPEAHRVLIQGEWSKQPQPLVKGADGVWSITVRGNLETPRAERASVAGNRSRDRSDQRER